MFVKLHSDLAFVLLCTISLLAAYGLTRILDPGANGAVETVSQEPAAPPLTPELAKQALLELNWFPAEAIPQVEQMKIREEDDGWYNWSCSEFHVERAEYILLLAPSRGSGACTFVFEGEFEFVDGRWQATPPKETGSYLDELDE